VQPIPLIVLSQRQIKPILAAHQRAEQHARTSLDLGITTADVELFAGGVTLPDGQHLSWEVIAAIDDDRDACWLIESGSARKIHAFSDEMQRAYSLLATDSAPTLIAAGFAMHRIKRSNPWDDTRAKIRAVSPVRGRVLDVNTGLGYTAIQAARTASQVVTIEIDRTVLEIARLNPWSRDLFTNPSIEQIVGDSFELVEEFDPGSFDLIVHDPPSFSLAGELYSGEFYQRLRRVVRPGGRLFHYIGNPESRQGQTVTRGVVRRLKEAGFTPVTSKPQAFGVLAYRPR
jgi:predicted methyltransferase